MIVDYKYITRMPHGHYPAGSSCVATIKESHLSLLFEDGTVVELDRARWYLEGIEPPRTYSDQCMYDLMAQEDAKFLALLDEAIKAGDKTHGT